MPIRPTHFHKEHIKNIYNASGGVCFEDREISRAHAYTQIYKVSIKYYYYYNPPFTLKNMFLIKWKCTDDTALCYLRRVYALIMNARERLYYTKIRVPAIANPEHLSPIRYTYFSIAAAAVTIYDRKKSTLGA